MNTLEVLIDARALIEKPENWCQEVIQRGNAFCSLGAICFLPAPSESLNAALLALELLVPNSCVATFNDTHSHAEVLALYDRAIATERTKQVQERTTPAVAAVMADALAGASAHQEAATAPHDPFRDAIAACDAILDRKDALEADLQALRAMTLADIAAADELLARLREGDVA